MNNKELFLSRTYQEMWNNFNESLQKNSVQCWDWIIITASNEYQVKTYRMQIEKRINNNFWPTNSQWMVVPDLNGERIGSGGSTFYVLSELLKIETYDELINKKILVLHSGGDSKRIPQYSASGKLFSPVPRCMPNGERSTIFDELLMSVSGIPSRIKSGMLVVSGDTLLLFNSFQLNLHDCDAAGLSMKASLDEGEKHGVFVKNAESKKVDYFLHKQSKEKLREMGAVDSFDNIDIDTGCIWLGKNVVSELIKLISKNGIVISSKLKKYANSKVCLNFYADIVYPLANKSSLEQYYREMPETDFSDELLQCRNEIWNAISKYNIELVRLEPSKFIHYGSTTELFRLLMFDLDNYKFIDWKRNILTNYCSDYGARNNVLISKTANISETTYIEDSIINENVIVNENTILSNVELKDIIIPSNVVLHCLPIDGDSYICRIYGVNDNPKGSADANFLTSSLHKFITKYNMDYKDIWEDDFTTIWNAKLYTKESSIQAAVESALNLYRMIFEEDNLSTFKAWKRRKRYSLKESFNMSNTQAIINWQESIKEKVKIQNFIQEISEGKDFNKVINIIGLKNITINIIDKINSIANNSEFPLNMRLYLALSDIIKRLELNSTKYDSMYYEDKAYEVIRKNVIDTVKNSYSWDKNNSKFIQDNITIQLPVRVNFGGGPSDAAPYCIEHGGTMIDAALLLNGNKPIEVVVKKLEEHVIIFESLDLNNKKVFSNLDELMEYSNPHDIFSLHKAVLVACGLIPVDINDTSLSDICNMIGGGLYLSTKVDVPKGSGLGTSSIIAAACIKAIREILGQSTSDDIIYEQVFLAEQLMTTGGGWQDQVGGLTPGVKFFYSHPGWKQIINVEYLKMSKQFEKEFDERFALIFSGQQRLARNVLREELNQFIRNDEVAMESIESIRQLCMDMKYQLYRGNITKFGQCLSKQFELFKKLDKGVSNTCIEYIFDVCDDLIDGKSICGAGGGGFLQVILKKGVTKEQLKARIDSEFLDSEVKVWDSNILF